MPCAPLQVAEHGNDRVQEVDVATQSHVGFLCPPGTLLGPRGVAASPVYIAVSTWRAEGVGEHVVHVFHADTHAAVMVVGWACGSVDGQLDRPMGLRITADGRWAAAGRGMGCVCG
jgi:hypothetical protein